MIKHFTHFAECQSRGGVSAELENSTTIEAHDEIGAEHRRNSQPEPGGTEIHREVPGICKLPCVIFCYSDVG